MKLQKIRFPFTERNEIKLPKMKSKQIPGRQNRIFEKHHSCPKFNFHFLLKIVGKLQIE